MRNVVRLLVTGGVLLLALASCDVLFMGFFPASAGQATARAVFTDTIPAAPAGNFSLAIVLSGEREYVLLFTDQAFDSSQVHLVVMDPQLKILETYTNAELLTIAGAFLNGKAAMTDANDQVVIGNLRFDALSTGLSFSSVNPVLAGPSINLRPIDFLYNETNYQVNGAFLEWTEYNSGWGGMLPYPSVLGTPAPPPQSTLRVVNVFKDQESASTPVVFVFRDDGSQRTYFLPIPKIDLEGDLVAGIFGNYPAPVVKDNLSPETIAYSRQGIIAYEQDSQSLVRFTLGAPGDEQRMSLGWVDRMQVAAGIAGTYCAVWDPGARVLTRYDKWW